MSIGRYTQATIRLITQPTFDPKCGILVAISDSIPISDADATTLVGYSLGSIPAVNGQSIECMISVAVIDHEAILVAELVGVEFESVYCELNLRACC
jgi:hypothetical protein